MKKGLLWFALVVVGVAAAWYFSVRQEMREVEQVSVLPPIPDPLPKITFPVEKIVIEPAPALESLTEPEPLPTMEDSDTVIIDEMAGIVGAETLDSYFILEQIISRVVATVDSLPSAKVAPLVLPVKKVPGKFTVLDVQDETVISPENEDRYAPYVALVSSVDAEQLVGVYVHYYPLFQQAYESLGYPDAYFNDRLVEVIDHLLEAPEPQGPIGLVKPEAVYLYKNPELEGLSAGQKTLIRMGNENAAIIKEKLREIRAAVTQEELSGNDQWLVTGN